MEEGAYDASEFQLEAEAVAAQRSIAISLKRIADALDDGSSHTLLETLRCIEMNGRQN